MEQRTQDTTTSTSTGTNSSNEKYKKNKNGVITEKGNDETSNQRKDVVPPLCLNSQSSSTVVTHTIDSKNQNVCVWRPTKANSIPSSQQYSGHEEMSTSRDKINTSSNSLPSSEPVAVASNTKESSISSSEETTLRLSSHRSQKKVRFVPQVRVGMSLSPSRKISFLE
jgi:hypothetical protein